MITILLCDNLYLHNKLKWKRRIAHCHYHSLWGPTPTQELEWNKQEEKPACWVLHSWLC